MFIVIRTRLSYIVKFRMNLPRMNSKKSNHIKVSKTKYRSGCFKKKSGYPFTVSVSSWDYCHVGKEKTVNHRANVSQKHYDAS